MNRFRAVGRRLSTVVRGAGQRARSRIAGSRRAASTSGS